MKEAWGIVGLGESYQMHTSPKSIIIAIIFDVTSYTEHVTLEKTICFLHSDFFKLCFLMEIISKWHL